jgi:hypothetical protein
MTVPTRLRRRSPSVISPRRQGPFSPG